MMFLPFGAAKQLPPSSKFPYENAKRATNSKQENFQYIFDDSAKQN